MTNRNVHTSKELLTRREFLVGGGAVLAVAAFAACTNKVATTTSGTSSTTTSSTTPTTASGSSSTPDYGGNLRMIIGSTGSPWGWPADFRANGAFESLETLLRQDGKGNTIPWLAESYNIADDYQSISFKLRKNIKFHDGSDFNAEVAKWNVENMIKSGLVSSWSSVDVIDDYAIKVNLKQWVNTTLSDFGDSQSPAQMVSKAAFDKHGIDWMRQNPTGTGPFKCTAFNMDASVKFERNPDYWVKSRPYLDAITYVCIADPATQKIAIQVGEADRTWADPGKIAKGYADMGLKVITMIDSNHFLVPDSGNPDSPWANQKVREALEYAIDKEAFAKTFGFGFLEAPYQIPARGSVAFNRDFATGRQYDAAKAKQLLEDAGYGKGIDTTIIVSPMGLGNNREVMVSVQSYLADAGINAKLEFPDIGLFTTYMYTGTWPKGTILCVPVPMKDAYFSGGISFIFNFVGKSWLITPELTEAYTAASTARSQDVKLIRAVTDKMTQDCLFIPFFEAGIGVAQKTNVICDFGERGGNYYTPEEAYIKK